MVTEDWLYQRTLNHRELEAMRRRQDWMALMLRINLSWYVHWGQMMTIAGSPSVKYDGRRYG